MAEVRNLFTGSKMNKDLDERLLPQGEYRDGQNISVSKSEGPDEGVVENILGNSLYSNFSFGAGVEIIGYFVDTNKDRIFVFATNFNDSSPDNLSNFPQGDVNDPAGGTIPGAKCIIAYIQGPLVNGNPDSAIIVQGNFLNFSKTHPMLGVDLIEDLLFFTDNRNQPRKINVETAIANPTYYSNEDHISVAKYAPFDAISFIDPVTDLPTYKNTLSEYFPAHAAGVVDSVTATSVVLKYGISDLDITAPENTRFININKPELGYFKLTNIFGGSVPAYTNVVFEYPIGSGNASGPSITAANAAATNLIGGSAVAFDNNDILMFEQNNAEYSSTFQGDENYLKDKFVRFSYRFKYDDNEYSLMAPFSQPLFVPKQYGYILDSAYEGRATKLDEKNTAESGVLKIMENQVTEANLIIDLPPQFNVNLLSGGSRVIQNQFKDQFKVEQVQILLKESISNAIRVVDEIVVDDSFTSSTLRYYDYRYVSNKPYKLLPSEVSTRTHDKIPIKAAAQATAGNRIIYGNFAEKHGSPENLNYNLSVGDKFTDGDPNLVNPERSRSRKEYPNHTVKQNRSYKVGIVLQDRYGRPSNVILRDESVFTGAATGEATSLYSPYKNIESVLIWPGDSIKIVFNDLIPSAKSQNYPGLFSGTNPTGYMTYKIVVQQKEQEYYNVFVPGACSGKITFKGQIGDTTNQGGNIGYNNAAAVSNIVLYGDNINKVPKELQEVGPTAEIFGSETLLYPRVVTKFLQTATNFPNVWVPTFAWSESSQVDFKSELTVNSILAYKDLGAWVANRSLTPLTYSSYPNDGTNFIDPLYLESSQNPFVAQLETEFLIGFSPAKQKAATPEFARGLNIFETNPVESELDIYWETSTSNTIVGLNQLINGGVTGGIGVDIGTPTVPSQPVAFSLEETQVPYPTAATSWIGDEFQAIDSNGNLMATGTIELVSVTNGHNQVLSPTPFDLVNTTGLRYRLRSNSYQWYGSDSLARTFNITLRILANGNNTVTKTCLLTNQAPLVTPNIFDIYNINQTFEWYPGENGAPSTSHGSQTNPYLISKDQSNGNLPGPGNKIGNFLELGTNDGGTTAALYNGAAGTNLQNSIQNEVVFEKANIASSDLFVFAGITPQRTIRVINDTTVIQNFITANGSKTLFKIAIKDCNGLTGSLTSFVSAWVNFQ